jgi:hypothetical protein
LMKHGKRLLAAVLAGVLTLGTGCVEARAEAPEYLKSVTYFGDEWPINYWGSEDKDMAANLARIAADGFNSIILVVPWRQFQPDTSSTLFNEEAFDRLEEILACAKMHGLWVTLRIGYSWDYYGDAALPARFEDIFMNDRYDRSAWLSYCKKLYETVSTHENFYGAFLTWEDFWEFSYSMSRDVIKSSRVRLAERCGYTEYLRTHYTLEEVSRRYREEFSDFSQVYIPFQDRMSAELFYEFYDQALMELLYESQQVFPGLSMEVRADADKVYNADGSHEYYSHSATYSCEGAEYPALMYSVSMGQKNVGDRITAAEALAGMERSLKGLCAQSGKKVYMEQFLYMDSTESVAQNTKIYDEEVEEFVLQSAPILKETTMGYGLWVYRNYVNNCVYNGQFGLGLEGWEHTGSVAVEGVNGTPMALLGRTGRLSQKLEGRLRRGEQIHIRLYAEPKIHPSMLTMRIGEKKVNIRVTEAGVYTASIPWTNSYNLEISTSRSVYLDDLKIYTYEQEGRIYGTDGEELDLAPAFRKLNENLDLKSDRE